MYAMSIANNIAKTIANTTVSKIPNNVENNVAENIKDNITSNILNITWIILTMPHSRNPHKRTCIYKSLEAEISSFEPPK